MLPKKWGYILLAPPPLAAGLTTVGVFIVVGSPSVPHSSQFTNCKPAVPKNSNKQTLDLDMFLVSLMGDPLLTAAQWYTMKTLCHYHVHNDSVICLKTSLQVIPSEDISFIVDYFDHTSEVGE